MDSQEVPPAFLPRLPHELMTGPEPKPMYSQSIVVFSRAFTNLQDLTITIGIKKKYLNHLVDYHSLSACAYIQITSKHQVILSPSSRTTKSTLFKSEDEDENENPQTHKSHQVIRDSTTSVLSGWCKIYMDAGMIRQAADTLLNTKENMTSFRQRH